MKEIIVTSAPYIVAILGLLGAVYTAVRANSNQLTAAYFSRMTEAYEQYWKAFSEFVYHPEDSTRNAYTVAVYNAVLYSGKDAATALQVLYHHAIDYTSGVYDTKDLDRWAGELEKILHEDVARFRNRGHRYIRLRGL